MSRARLDPGNSPLPGAVSALLGIGSNLGDREASIERAVSLLDEVDGVEVAAVSRLIETDPVGGPPQGRYLNGAVDVRTILEPIALLGALQRIEASLGRVRGGAAVRWGPRPIDIDILLHGDLVVSEPGLEIPHPRMLEREFVLEPLAEIAPDRIHPISGRTIREHLLALRASRSLEEGAR